jgi:(p)ppGpp synthase/HD superfamily hydrolase
MVKQPKSINLCLKAISYAARQHDGQFRKDNETPYIAHPMRVMTILSEVFAVRDREILAAAVLHDTIEDTDSDQEEISQEFGHRVAEYVDALSKESNLNRKTREARYAKCLERAATAVKLCKLADLYDNLTDRHALTDKKVLLTADRADHLRERLVQDLPKKWHHIDEILRSKISEARRAAG